MKALVHKRLARGSLLGLAVAALAVPMAQAGSHHTEPRINRLDALIATMEPAQLNTLAPIFAKLFLRHERR
jgi:hypothetical protein